MYFLLFPFNHYFQTRYGEDNVANPLATPPSSTFSNLVLSKKPEYSLCKVVSPSKDCKIVPKHPNSDILSPLPSTISACQPEPLCEKGTKMRKC